MGTAWPACNDETRRILRDRARLGKVWQVGPANLRPTKPQDNPRARRGSKRLPDNPRAPRGPKKVRRIFESSSKKLQEAPRQPKSSKRPQVGPVNFRPTRPQDNPRAPRGSRRLQKVQKVIIRCGEGAPRQPKLQEASKRSGECLAQEAPRQPKSSKRLQEVARSLPSLFGLLGLRDLPGLPARLGGKRRIL